MSLFPLLCIVGSQIARQGAESVLRPSDVTQVVMLGSGPPIPDPRHQGPAVAIVVNGQPYIVDCGPGIVRQATAATAHGIKGLGLEKLTRVFITHLHSDHTMGLPDLLFTPSIMNRVQPVEVFGPKGLKRMTGLIERAWSEDRDIRIHGGEGEKPSEYEGHAQDVKPGLIYSDANVKVTAFAVEHGNWKSAFGYRFETPDRVIVVSGDTTYCENLIENAKGCDILIHEAYSAKGLDLREQRWKDYHSRYHTSGPDVGRVANQVKPKLLVLYHELPFGQPQREILSEVKSEYEGPVLEAEDLATY